MMGKDPAFLWYPNDYLGGTMGMTFEEKGAYVDLLMAQFNRGHMTSHMVGQIVGQLWNKIKDKFLQDENGLWYNERIDLEKTKRRAFTTSRKNNLSGHNQHSKNKKNTGHMAGHMTSHMENENENENINTIRDKIERFKKEVDQLSESYPNSMLEDFFDYWSEKNKSGTKMRWELQKTWEIGKRLKNWDKRSSVFSKPTGSKFGPQDVSREEIVENIKKTEEILNGRENRDI